MTTSTSSTSHGGMTSISVSNAFSQALWGSSFDLKLVKAWPDGMINIKLKLLLMATYLLRDKSDIARIVDTSTTYALLTVFALLNYYYPTRELRRISVTLDTSNIQALRDFNIANVESQWPDTTSFNILRSVRLVHRTAHNLHLQVSSTLIILL